MAVFRSVRRDVHLARSISLRRKMAWQPDNVGLMTAARGPCSLGSRVEAALLADRAFELAGAALLADCPVKLAVADCGKAC